MEFLTRVIEFKLHYQPSHQAKISSGIFYAAFPNLKQSKNMFFAKRWTSTRDLVLIAYAQMPLMNTYVVLVVEIQPLKGSTAFADFGHIFRIGLNKVSF